MSGRPKRKAAQGVNYTEKPEEPPRSGRGQKRGRADNNKPPAKIGRRQTNLNVSGNNGGLLIGPNMYFLKNLILLV